MGKHHLAGWQSPWSVGLLSGIAAGANSVDQYNKMEAIIQGRIKAYDVKYGNMASVAQMKQQNAVLMKQLQMEGTQRSYKTQTVGQDGKTYDVYMRNVYNPDTKRFEPQEISRAPASSQGKAPVTRAFGDQIKQYNPDKGTWDTIGSNVHAGQQGAIADRQAVRDKAVGDRENARLQSQKAAKLDMAVAKDMDKFDKADPDTKKQMLKAAGVAETNTVDNPDYGKHSLMHPQGGDPTMDQANPDMRAQYEAAMEAKHAKRIGVKPDAPATDSAQPAASKAQPDMTPDGREIRYNDKGQPFVKDKNGNPAPYVADANGQPTSGLAMDDTSGHVVDADGNAKNQDEENSDDQQQGGGLLASNGEQDEGDMNSPQSQTEDENDDAEQEKGLLG